MPPSPGILNPCVQKLQIIINIVVIAVVVMVFLLHLSYGMLCSNFLKSV